MQLIKVSPNKRFLCYEDGVPFFWLGDTAWELLQKLTDDEIDLYLSDRASKGFNVVQTVAIFSFDSSNTGDSRGVAPFFADTEGRFDLALANETFWKRMDRMIDKAHEYGIYVALLPTWGDKVNKMPYSPGPEIFNIENAAAYGRWISERYTNRPNIVWVMGGDIPLYRQRHHQVFSAMAHAIKEADNNKHLMTFHPPGKSSSSKHTHDEDWLDFNMLQSSHSVLDMPTYQMVASDLNLSPLKPTLDGEPCYEDHPFNFEASNGYIDAANVRKSAYWSVFAGACGFTYGHHCVWHMENTPGEYFIMSWRDALSRPGAMQMKYLKELLLSHPYFDRRTADDILSNNYAGSNHQVATRGGNYALVYSPNGLNIQMKLGILQGHRLKAQFFNPRNGEMSFIGEFANEGSMTFQTPMKGRGEDIVLVVHTA